MLGITSGLPSGGFAPESSTAVELETPASRDGRKFLGHASESAHGPARSARLSAGAERGPPPDGRVLPEAEEIIATPTRRFSLLEITSGLPDDGREADEKVVGRQLREIRARVKRGRAIVATTPGLSEILHADCRKATWFYDRFGTTQTTFQHGVFADDAPSDGPIDAIWQPMGALARAGERIEEAPPPIENA